MTPRVMESMLPAIAAFVGACVPLTGAAFYLGARLGRLEAKVASLDYSVGRIWEKVNGESEYQGGQNP